MAAKRPRQTDLDAAQREIADYVLNNDTRDDIN